MSETLMILQKIIAALASGYSASLAIIVERAGSAPRGTGAMLAALPDGFCCGTVGGGRLEQLVLDELRQELLTSRLRRYELLPEQDGMPCGGSVGVLLARVLPDAITAFSAAAEALGAGTPCTLYAVPDESGLVSWQLEPPRSGNPLSSVLLQPAPVLVICGAGHIAHALAPMADQSGFSVTVLDDRLDYLSGHPFGEQIRVCPVSSFEGCLPGQRITAGSFILIATYSHQYDRIVLEQALKTDAGYIGMVGSRRKREELFAALCTAGVADTALSRVRCPVGLAIGAETPAEIAVSILAEMIAARRGRG